MAATSTGRLPGLAPARAAPATRPSPRRRRAALRVAAAQQGYVAPSRVGATELEALERFSEVVPDVVLSQSLSSLEKPKAATVSRAVLAGLLASPGCDPQLRFAIEQARFFDRCAALPAGAARLGCQVDKALVNVGAALARAVPGRVSTEVDPRDAGDAAALVRRGLGLVALYGEAGVPPSRVLLRLPATWAGVQAAARLEAGGAATHLVLVASFAQGAAAAAAGASVVQPNVGNVADWYERNPGAPRGRGAPREAAAMARAGFGAPPPNAGVELVQKLYAYCRTRAPRTKIMAAGLRSREDAAALAGCDYLVVGPRLLASLAAAPTAEGYNDGLTAAGGGAPAGPRLTPAWAAAYEWEDSDEPPSTEAAFTEAMGMAGRELLAQGLSRLVEDAERADAAIGAVTSGQE